MTRLQSLHFENFDRLSILRARRTDATESYMLKPVGANEVYERMEERSSAIKYVVGAMQPIDPTYTENTYREGERVRNQLEKSLCGQGIVCEFDYQGSVTNDTHIRAKSDIDLLTLHCAFVSLDPPQRVSSPYCGNPVEDLLELRRSSIRVLKEKFPEATVDSSGSKSVCIEGGSLRRKIDVVASNWCDTNEYRVTRLKRDRAIHVLDAHKLERLRNLPFLHNARLHDKDQRTNGGYRKAVRLLKSLKYDSQTEVRLSSYDIAAIVYAIDDQKLNVYKGMELLLLDHCKKHLDFLNDNKWYRDALFVPNGTRKIFCTEGASVTGLNDLQREVNRLNYEIENDLTRSFRNLAEARVEY
ncbi:MAG: hypothetical protein JNL67_07195 [Planctomycetaceae bacterium]|nr:hypothetical protein [Planctomycetaceae bacterium]